MVAVPKPASASVVVPMGYTPKHLAERILRSRAALEGERKQVTVLFADIKGSMELIQNVDPEQARRFLDSAVETMMAAVHRYEGTVNKVLGDGVMALFGAPIAHEDHAVRACYAALAMQAAFTRLADTTRREFGVELQVRIGLHSGEVVVRAIGNDLTMDYDAIGATTHLASRMEQLAPPGSIRLTADTLRLAEGLVLVRSLGPIPVKGLPQPIEVFDLIGASQVRSRLQAAAVAGFTRFVGREAEMDSLAAALERAKSGAGQVIAVVGEAGIGKSRLFHEFVHSYRVADWLVLESGSVSHGKATAYLPLIDLVKRYFQIDDADDARRVREKVIGKLLNLDDGLRPTLPALLALLDVPADDVDWTNSDPAQRRRRTLDACRALLLREAEEQPIIVVFEDLHWTDSESLAFIDGLIDSLPKVRVLLLLNFRPEFRDRWSARSYYTRIRIDPLRPQGSAALLTDRLGDDASLEPLKRLLVTQTEGNPFFLEECVRTLAEGDALVGARGAYRLVAPITSITLPVTVQSVLAARIDRLAPEDKRLLQSASVMGKDFSLSLLREIADADGDQLLRSLANLQSAEFIYETRLFPDPEYTFKHALTHDVAYGSLLAERRNALHGAIVAAIERLYAERLPEYVDRLAYHAARAADWEKAYAYGLQAGRRASERSANQAALDAFELALAALGHLPDTDETVAQAIDLRFELRDALFVLNRLDAILRHVERAEALAVQIGDRRRQALAALYMSGFYWYNIQLELAVERAEAALKIAEDLDDAELVVLAHYRLGTAHHHLGNYRAAEAAFGTAIDLLSDRVGRSLFRFGGVVFCFCCSFRAWALAELGELVQAEQIGRLGMQIAEQAKHGYSISVASFGLASGYLLSQKWQLAIAVLERGMEQIDVHGINATIGWVAARLAYAYAVTGRAAEAQVLLDRVRDPTVLHATSDAGFPVWLGMAGLANESLAPAEDFAQRAIGAAHRTGERGAEVWALWLLGQIELRRERPDPATAASHFRGGLSQARALDMRLAIMYCHEGLGQAGLLAGRRPEMAAEFCAALDLADGLGIASIAERLRGQLAAAGIVPRSVAK